MDSLRWGLLSTARINRRVIPAIRISKRSSLVAVASRDLEKAKAYAAEWKIPTVFGSYEEMLSSDSIDAVYISLPNDLHAEWSIKALQAGKHVLCEKPFAVSLQDVDCMVQASQESRRTIAEAFMYRHHPQTGLVMELLRSGRIGDVIGMQSSFHFSIDQAVNIRLDPARAGGCLWDVGVYPLSYSQMVMGGPPRQVTGWQQVGPTGVDLSFFGQMVYAQGQVSQITSSFNSPFHARAEILGSQGRLLVTRPFSALNEGEVILSKPDGSFEQIPVPSRELYLGEIEDMEICALDGGQQRVTLAQTRDHIRTALALYQSAREGRTVTLE